MIQIFTLVVLQNILLCQASEMANFEVSWYYFKSV